MSNRRTLVGLVLALSSAAGCSAGGASTDAAAKNSPRSDVPQCSGVAEGARVPDGFDGCVDGQTIRATLAWDCDNGGEFHLVGDEPESFWWLTDEMIFHRDDPDKPALWAVCLTEEDGGGGDSTASPASAPESISTSSPADDANEVVAPVGACGGTLDTILSKPVPAAGDFECDGSGAMSVECDDGTTVWVVAIGINDSGVEVDLAGRSGGEWRLIDDATAQMPKC